ncbi:MAG: G2-specific serine/threonine protein kinase [Cirrosporium novae-zelandiae]|nr:MAG: G2-specific serine/threonine protein kinase [Cirrosporium novae-zelandiae]
MTEPSKYSDNYDVLEKIGHGSFGVIRKVRRRDNGKVLVRKEISYLKMSQKERDQLAAEFNILSSLKHPNIVGYYHREHVKETQDLYLYMEYCDSGDLGGYIKKLTDRNQVAEENFVWSIFTQLVTALYRCHYGQDPPNVGTNILSKEPKSTKLRGKQAHAVILHRDLKPENVFLTDDDTVKLGDFGLSKVMSSQDFASTYVGTPFYMSPEICGAERYTVYSDIWSLGCIIYELCMKTPPFNARTHINLIQKIKAGVYPPLPACYSQDLHEVISKCLRVNPSRRPDTAELLELPIVKLMRKEREVVHLGRTLRSKEELAARKIKEADDRLRHLQTQQDQMRLEIDATVRREWEVKARLEITRQIQLEKERLDRQFAIELEEKVKAEVQRQLKEQLKEQSTNNANSHHEVSQTVTFGPLSSVSTNGDTDFPSSTDLSELSVESPEVPITKPKKTSRTPFSRARTTVESPMDIQMAEPSPITIQSLSLSPRRHATTASLENRNIFAAAAERRAKWEPDLAYSEDDDDDDIPELPSPTLPRASKDPFKMPPRPNMARQMTAPLKRLQTQPDLFHMAERKSHNQVKLSSPTSHSQPSIRSNALDEKTPTSPHRRLSKIPSSTTLATDAGSPVRKTTSKLNLSKTQANGGDTFRNGLHRNIGGPTGRTLVELAQARAGGRAIDIVEPVISRKAKRQTISAVENNFVASRMTEEPPVWDPMVDDMPSPFLVRGTKGLR